jgi:PAS domain-containing protein
VAANGPHSTGAEVALFSCVAILLASPGAPMIRTVLPTLPVEITGSMHDGRFLVGPDGRIAPVNQALLRMTGFRRDEREGRPCAASSAWWRRRPSATPR